MDAVPSAGRAEHLERYPQVFFRDRFARSFGWEPRLFQLDIAAATFAIGLGAIAAAVLGRAAAWAMFFVTAGFMWDAAAIHVSDMVQSGNLLTKNIGPFSGGTSSRR